MHVRTYAVFLEPTFLITLLKPLFEHRLSVERRRGSMAAFAKQEHVAKEDRGLQDRLQKRVKELVDEGKPRCGQLQRVTRTSLPIRSRIPPDAWQPKLRLPRE